LTDYEDIVITVNNVNRPPQLDPIGSKTINVGQLLTFTVSATDPDGDSLEYSAPLLPDGASFNTMTQTFSWTPTSAGTYTNVRFQASDSSLNDFEDVTITVTAGSDGVPPQISSVSLPNVTDASADISWTTDEPSNSQVEYWASPSTLSDLDENMVIQHEISLSGLEPNTTYHYRVMSTDEAGNTAVYEGGVFTTLDETGDDGPDGGNDVTLLDGSNFSVSRLSIRSSRMFFSNRTSISVIVSNDGDTSGSYTVVIQINSEEEDTKDVFLAAGERQWVTFYTSKDEPGIYEVDVNGLTGSFEVMDTSYSRWGRSWSFFRR
jgi:hypothetical protein